MKLSKTTYQLWRACRHNAWYKLHAPEIYQAQPLSEFDKTVIETGNEIDLMARGLFPGGVEVPRDSVVETKALIAASTHILYQPVFESGDLVAICDILVWNGSAYDLYEVKASSSAEDKMLREDEYAYDIGFQLHVLMANDIPVGRCYLVRLNRTYVRHGALDLGSLLTREDYTDCVHAILPDIADEIALAIRTLDQQAPPSSPCDCIRKGRSAHCTTFGASNPDVPDYSVHDIARIGASKRKLESLIDRGIVRIDDVPDDLGLSESQRNQIAVARSGVAIIDRTAVREFLARFEMPVAFLDYETFSAAVPRFEGYRPYDQIPFQFSLDVFDGGDLHHHEFLSNDPVRPDDAFIAALDLYLPDRGSVIVWNKSFELTINKRLAERNPAVAALLEAVAGRVIDLEDVFKKQMVVHPAFRGKTSIKKVLPVMVPDLSYKGLAIQEGATASDTWNRLVTASLTADEIEHVRRDLLAYCGLDTKAMVEIYRALQRIASDAERSSAA